MKTKYLFLTAALGLTVTLSSCEKEDILPEVVATPSSPATTPPPASPGTTTPPPATTPSPGTQPQAGAGNLLTRMGERSFTYDAQGRLVGLSYHSSPTLGYSIVYDGDKPTRLNYNTGAYLLYTYSGDKVTSAVMYGTTGLVVHRYTFEYAGDKLVKETDMSYTRSDAGQLGIIEYDYDANKNLTKITTTWSTSNRVEDMGRSSVITFGSYDNQKHPESFIASGMYYLPGVKLFKNNPGYRDPGYGKEFFSYSFNDKGYPVNRYTRLEAYPHVQPFVDSYEYK